MVLLLAALLPVMAIAGPVRAQDPGADWQLTGLTGPVLQLFTPSSGAFFARTGTELFRSDDGGATWRPVPLPAPPDGGRGSTRQWATVDPTDHSVLYAGGANGLYKSADAGDTWQMVLRAPTTAATVTAIAVSPADARIVYAIFQSGASSLALFRSLDGGGAWSQVLALPGPGAGPCTAGVNILQAHPSDARRVFLTAGCYAGRDFGGPLSESTDQGATWSPAFRVQGTFPRLLVGGAGRTPGRFYLAANAANPGFHSIIARSDDDGRNWVEVLTREEGSIAGLAYDPSAPERVYAGLGGAGAGVQVSRDGGSTWAELGLADQVIHDLALGIDALNLYAATDQGVWRLPATPGGAGLAGG